MTGLPLIARPAFGLTAPNRRISGTDLAGTVVAVGATVTSVAVGDEVFGTGPGTFAELVVTTPDRLALRPDAVSPEQAAAVPVAGVTALQGLRDNGRVRPGQRVLINGASGGVGTYAVQIAKVLGAEVTAVCSTRNVELVTELGADHVIDYTTEDFTTGGERYDVILDIVGSRPPRECRRVLADDGRFVVVGGSRESRWFGPVAHLVSSTWYFARQAPTCVSFTADETSEDLATLAGWIASGQVVSSIGHRFSLDEAADALRLIESGRARGKAVVAVA